MKKKTYYKFSDILKLTGISERTYRYRISELKEKYKESSDLLYKKGGVWRIHFSIINEFYTKKIPK